MGPMISRCIGDAPGCEPPQVHPSTTGSGVATQQQPAHVAERVTEPRSRETRQGQSSAQQLLRAGQLVPPSALEHQGRPVKTVNLQPTRTPAMINDLEQYLQWRREGGRSVSPPTQRLLERATKAVETVREQIPMRGNVRTDIKQTGGEASWRLVVARRTVKSELSALARFAPIPSELKGIAISAAAARITGSGNCQEMMDATFIEAGTELQENERLIGVVDARANHVFAHLKSIRVDGTKRVVVLDAWANGPAVLQEDHACEPQSVLERPYLGIKSPTDAKNAKRLASELEAAHNQDFFRSTVTKSRLKELKDQGYRLAEDCLYDEKNVTSLHGPINNSQS